MSAESSISILNWNILADNLKNKNYKVEWKTRAKDIADYIKTSYKENNKEEEYKEEEYKEEEYKEDNKEDK